MSTGARKPSYRIVYLYTPRHRDSGSWAIVHKSKGTGKTGSTIGTTRQQRKRWGHQRAAHWDTAIIAIFIYT